MGFSAIWAAMAAQSHIGIGDGAVRDGDACAFFTLERLAHIAGGVALDEEHEVLAHSGLKGLAVGERHGAGIAGSCRRRSAGHRIGGHLGSHGLGKGDGVGDVLLVGVDGVGGVHKSDGLGEGDLKVTGEAGDGHQFAGGVGVGATESHVGVGDGSVGDGDAGALFPFQRLAHIAGGVALDEEHEVFAHGGLKGLAVGERHGAGTAGRFRRGFGFHSGSLRFQGRSGCFRRSFFGRRGGLLRGCFRRCFRSGSCGRSGRRRCRGAAAGGEKTGDQADRQHKRQGSQFHFHFLLMHWIIGQQGLPQNKL